MTNSSNSSFVAVVKVKKFLTFKDVYFEESSTHLPISMEVEVVEICKGKENRKTLIVWGSPGHLCRQYLSVFREGNFYVIAFLPAPETKNDYTLSSCGTNFLAVDNDQSLVTGDIGINDRKSETISLLELKAAITKQKKTIYRFDESAFIDGCGNFGLQKKSIDNRHELRVHVDSDSLSSTRIYKVSDTLKFIKIELREYPQENGFIERLCTDVGPAHDKEPNVYLAVSGTVIINMSPIKDNYGRFRVSVTLINIELKDMNNKYINLPTERFDDIRVGWLAG